MLMAWPKEEGLTSLMAGDHDHQCEPSLTVKVLRFEELASRHSSSIVVVELECRSLCIILLFEEALEAAAALKRL